MTTGQPGFRVMCRNAIEILFLAALLLGGYAMFQGFTKLSAILLESNLQSNLARISRYVHAPQAETVLVGSSVTGRLLPSYFKEQGMVVYNLGLDGCHAPVGLEVVLMRKELPKLVLVEASALQTDPNPNEQTLREAFNSPTFRMGGTIGVLRPENRPLSILYWRIKQLSDTKPGPITHWAGTRENQESAPASVNSKRELDEDTQIEKLLSNLKGLGVDVRLLVIPHGEGWGVPLSGRIRKIAAKVGIPVVEPGVELAKLETLRFTDGLHLDVESAKALVCATVKLLRCDKEPKQ